MSDTESRKAAALQALATELARASLRLCAINEDLTVKPVILGVELQDTMITLGQWMNTLVLWETSPPTRAEVQSLGAQMSIRERNISETLEKTGLVPILYPMDPRRKP